MKRLIIQLAVNAVALYAAVYFLNGKGITANTENLVPFIWLGLIFGVVNALLKPLLTVLTCPLIILTLGFGTLFINTLLFYLTSIIGNRFNIDFSVDSFGGAFLGALIVSIVSIVLNLFLKDE